MTADATAGDAKLPANLERQLHFQPRTLATTLPNQESGSKGSFNSSWFWGRQCPFMVAMRAMVEKLKLTVNDDKTHLCRIPQERFDFLGYTFGRCYNRESGRAYIGTRPSRKSIKRMIASITEETDRRRTLLDADYVVERLNRKLTGWANYFCLGRPVSPAYKALDTHVTQRLRRWFCKKHKVCGKGVTRYSNQYLREQLGLVNLPARTRNLPWAKA